MANTYTWSIKSLHTLAQSNKQNDVIYLAQFTLSGTDGINTASMTISQPLTCSEDSFTPFSSVTEEEVIGWIQKEFGTDGVANLQASIDAQINSIVNPPVLSLQTLPWL